MINLFVNHLPVKFETTIFPDGTSQIWKIEDEAVKLMSDNPQTSVTSLDFIIRIVWLFEHEAELIHLCQLLTLLIEVSDTRLFKVIELYIPYFPYARQDKEVSNTNTFALGIIVDILSSYNCRVCYMKLAAYDIHSSIKLKFPKGQDNIEFCNISPKEFHESLPYKDSVICYPDKGAALRYQNSFPNQQNVYFEKIRNQQTGEIISYHLLGLNGIDLNQLISQDVLIIDDICDGGATFINAAQKLKEYGFKNIDLAVSHGLFSKGKQVLYDAGIRNIYTTNSLLRNPTGFDVLYYLRNDYA